MQPLILFLTIVALDVAVCGANEYEDIKGLLSRSTLTGCRTPTDVIFLLDASSSIWGPDFRKHLDFVKTVIRDLRMDPSMVRCGLVTYGDEVRVEFGLRTYSRAETAMTAVSLVSQLRGSTRTDLALRRMREMMEEDKRPGVPRIGIVLTDGQSDYPSATRQEAEMAHQAGIALIAVGIGREVDLRELRTIASQEDFMFLLSSQKDLEVLKRFLSRTICSFSEEQQDEDKDEFWTLTECEDVPLDIAFLLDHSLARFPENLQSSQRFVKDCLTMLSISKDEAHVSVITFGDLARLQFDLDTYSNVTEIRLATSRIGLRKSQTAIADALRILGSPGRRYREQAVKVAVILTGGRAGDPRSVLLEATRIKEELGVLVFVIGVGDGVDRKELEAMASFLSVQTIYLVESYVDLAPITPKLITTICGLGAKFRSTKVPQASKPAVVSPHGKPLTTGTPIVEIPIVTSNTVSQSTETSEWFLETTSAATTEETPSTQTIEATATTEYSGKLSRAPFGEKSPEIQSNTETGHYIPSFTSTPNVWPMWTSSFPARPRTLPYRNCYTQTSVDIVFALPSSLEPVETSHALEFVAILSDQLRLDGKAVRFGVTPRLCPPHVPGFTLDQGSRSGQLKKALDARRLTNDYSDTVSLLSHLDEVSFSDEQMAGRDSATKIAVVLLDSKDEVSENVIREVNRLKTKWVVVVGVLVGERDDTTHPNLGFRALTSCPSCLLHAKSYAELDGELSDKLATIVTDHRCIRQVEPN